MSIGYAHNLCKGVRSPRTRVIDGCEPPYGCWELNPGPLEKTVEPCLQPSEFYSQTSLKAG